MFWVSDIIDTASDCDHFVTIGLVQWKEIVTRLGFGTSKNQILTQDGVRSHVPRWGTFPCSKMGYVPMFQDGVRSHVPSVKGGFCVCSEVSEERVASSGGSGWPCKVHVYCTYVSRVTCKRSFCIPCSVKRVHHCNLVHPCSEKKITNLCDRRGALLLTPILSKRM